MRSRPRQDSTVRNRFLKRGREMQLPREFRDGCARKAAGTEILHRIGDRAPSPGRATGVSCVKPACGRLAQFLWPELLWLAAKVGI